MGQPRRHQALIAAVAIVALVAGGSAMDYILSGMLAGKRVG